jgi:hypothetical protein
MGAGITFSFCEKVFSIPKYKVSIIGRNIFTVWFFMG